MSSKQRVIAAFLAMMAGGSTAYGQRGGNGGLNTLKNVPVPQPVGADKYVADQAALVALGKVFFWDMQVGSDGKTACASCHFHAGADHRLQNQLSGAGAVATKTLTLSDFPFHRLSNPNDNRSPVLSDTRLVAGSAGVAAGTFVDIIPGQAVEEGTGIVTNVRQVTGRNTPSVINAVFNARNFWDGRARSNFSGATPFGQSDTGMNAWVETLGQLTAERVSVEQASLASQAVGPALNEVEMSLAGKSWVKLGRKMVQLAPLGRQKVALDDSVLGNLADPSGFGLRAEYSYEALVKAAFRPEYWNASVRDAAGYSQMEANFALYWGLALQAYEATLVADDSRVDQFLEGNTNALTALEQQGLRVFSGGASQCQNCHGGPETTAASVRAVTNRGNPTSAADFGFFRIGVRPIEDDLGLGGTDGFGLPLLETARLGTANGTFKAPSLRNVELTGPYFHNGGQATLEQVVDFYARNGDFPDGGNLGPGIGAIRLNQQNRTALVAFLKALTDERVRYERAPFDHPSLCVASGSGEAGDQWQLVAAVGRGGGLEPLRSFEELLRDGTKVGDAEEARRYCGVQP